VDGGPPGAVGLGKEVAGHRVLGVGHRGSGAAGDVGHRGQERGDVGVGGAEAAAGPDGAGDVPAVTGQDVAAGLGHRAGAEAEQPQQIGVGTEAAVPDPDAPFGAEPGGDEAVVDPLDGEGGDRQGVIAGAGGGPEEPDTVDGGEAAAQQPGQVGLVGDDGRPADGGELGHGGAESDGAD